jgi:hypothetical protein
VKAAHEPGVFPGAGFPLPMNHVVVAQASRLRVPAASRRLDETWGGTPQEPRRRGRLRYVQGRKARCMFGEFSPHPSLPLGERVSEGRVRGMPCGSWAQSIPVLTERKPSLNLPACRRRLDDAWGLGPPLTPALSPLRGEGGATAVAGNSKAKRRVRARVVFSGDTARGSARRVKSASGAAHMRRVGPGVLLPND